MKKWHPKYFHFLKLCVLLSDDIFLFVFQVDSDFFRALFFLFVEKNCQPQKPTSKRKHPTSSASALHMWILPPRCSNRQKYLDMFGHVRKVDTSSFNMVIFYIPICSQLRPGLPTVIGGRVEEQDRCLWKLWKHLSRKCLNHISVNLWTCHILSIIEGSLEV